MSIVHLTEASPGAPRLSGTNGDLCGVLDWALPQNGWAIEYTATNARVYRPGIGNRFRLAVQHDSAVSGNAGLAVVRGCENASSATTLVDPFPTVALVANTSANWLVSSAVNTTGRAFDIFIAPTWVHFIVNFSGASNVWEWNFFGDVSPSLSGDSYNTLVTVRNSSLTSSPVVFSGSTTNAGLFQTKNTVWWCRDFSGTVKSTTGALTAGLVSNGVISAAPQIFAGPSGKLESKKVEVCDAGGTTTTPSSTLSIACRGWMPNIRLPLHSGRQVSTPNSRDVFSDSGYDPLFLGTVFTQSNGAAGVTLVIEGSDTWVPPDG